MKRPTSVTLLGFKIKIIYKKELNDPKTEFELFGYYSESKKEIHLSEDQTEEEMLSTLIHECTHAIIRLSSHSENMSSKQEEVVCRLVEHIAPLVFLRDPCKSIKYGK